MTDKNRKALIAAILDAIQDDGIRDIPTLVGRMCDKFAHRPISLVEICEVVAAQLARTRKWEEN